MLIVEDDSTLIEDLKRKYRQIFQSQGYDSIVIEEAKSAQEARELARSATAQSYDLVSLDVNLGDAVLTGLDVLRSFDRFQSAWMVVLLTGVETDPSVDQTMGKEKGDTLRSNLRKDAHELFPPERLIVVEKPSHGLEKDQADRLLDDRVRQISLIYDQIGRQRYIFKPIEVTSLERVKAPKGSSRKHRKFIETVSLHWQIRFNCGPIRTLPDKAGFRTIHHLLKMPREDTLTPEEALVIEPSKDKEASVPRSEVDPVSEYFNNMGVDWENLEEVEKDRMIRAALSHRFKRYVELREYEDQEDLSANEEEELKRLIDDLGPLASVAETGYQRSHAERSGPVSDEVIRQANIFEGELYSDGTDYTKNRSGQWRSDSKEGASFRQRRSRVNKYLRENGFAELAEHFEDYIQSTGANWSYNPPAGIEWTT